MSHTVTALSLAQAYVDHLLVHEAKSAGLADEFIEAVKAKMSEIDADKSKTAAEKLAEFDILTKAMEDHAREQIDASEHWEAGTTLSKASPNYRGVKSTVRRGIKADLDPRDYKSYNAFRKATLDTGKSGSGKGGGKSVTSDAGTTSNGTNAAPAAPEPVNDTGNAADSDTGNVKAMPNPLDGLSPSVRNAVYAALKSMESLPEDQQLQVANGFVSVAKKKVRALSTTGMKKAANQ